MFKIASMIALFLGLGMMAWGGYKVFWVNRVSNWPTETGEVIDTRVMERRFGYGVEVRVRFRVDGEEYISRRYSFTQDRFSRERAEDIASRYWEGVMASVRYNPRDPGESALKYHLPMTYMLLLVGGGLLFFGSLGGLR
ncbi:DUF3592 domain-containing protein [Ectothiorhodospiraceae bacterium WFHF3C12]|nr:DUF3592 domain-containing protein [Ectothiorhodospiraceae bacterium WFHF3C12]